MNNWESGHLAEKAARFFLLFKGYCLVKANYITGRGTTAGEIDLIVQRGKTLVFAEVKKRASIEKAAYALKRHQQERIRRAAANFVAKHPQYQTYNIRFDVVLVCFPFSIMHIKNAF